MHKDTKPNYYDVSDEEVKENDNDNDDDDDKHLITKKEMPNKKVVRADDNEHKRRRSSSHSRSKHRHHYRKRYNNRSRHSRDRRHRSRSYESRSSYTSSSNNSQSSRYYQQNKKRETKRQYSFSSSSSSSSSSFNKERKTKIKTKGKEDSIGRDSNVIKTAFENEFETNNHQSQPKWSSPKDNNNNIKTLKISNKGKTIEVIMSNQLKPSAKEHPNFSASGLLAKQTNTQNGVVLKYTTPQDAGNPINNWRLYEFHKGSDEAKSIHRLNGMNYFLIGKDTRVSAIILENMSCSRQHAVIQFRKKINENLSEDVVPYVIDLESTNGTLLNKEKIQPSVYYELKNKDVLNFGDENLDYVVMALCHQ